MQVDFSKYTLEELLDIERNIDKDAYPERYEIVCSLIKLKEADPVEVDSIELKEKSNKIHRALYVVGLFWFFALYSLIKGEFTIKSYTATFANEPLAFFLWRWVLFLLWLIFLFTV